MERDNTYRVWIGVPEGMVYFENLGLDGRIILSFVFKRMRGHGLN
jgi:hypothetical protein